VSAISNSKRPIDGAALIFGELDVINYRERDKLTGRTTPKFRSLLQMAEEMEQEERDKGDDEEGEEDKSDKVDQSSSINQDM